MSCFSARISAGRSNAPRLGPWRAAGIFLLLCASPLGALPSPGAQHQSPPETRVLPPSAAEVVRQAFRRAEPLLRLKGARIHPDAVQATVCSAATCRVLRLTYPTPACKGFVAGPWCVTSQGGGLPSEQQRALRQALAGDAVTEVWRALSPPTAPSGGEGPRPPAEPSPSPTNALAYLFAALYLVAPLLMGWGAGRLLRRLRRRGFRSGWTAVAFIGGCVGCSLLLVPMVRLALWDLVAPAVLLGAGAHVGARDDSRRWDRRNLALLAGSTAASLLLLELSVRWLLPAPPTFVQAREVTIMRDRTLLDDWAKIYPDAYPKRFRRLIQVPPQTRWRVVHVGDSMVFGIGVKRAQRFTSLLQRRFPHAAHLNAAVPGTGTDFHYLVIKRWLAHMRAQHVVHYVFPTNDLLELDRPHEVCRGGSLLIYRPSGITPRCRRPTHDPDSLQARYLHSLYLRPAPYPLLVATSFSALARHICALPQRFVHHSYRVDPSRARRHFARLLRQSRNLARAHNAAYTVVILPYRAALERRSRSQPSKKLRPHQEIRRICREIAPRVLDAWDALLPLVRKHGGERYFTDSIHLSPEGHRVVAGWLARHLAGTPGFGPPAPN